jgi:hypothetical protein
VIPKVFKIKPALVASYNVMTLIVLLHSQRSQHRMTHLDASKLQIICEDHRPQMRLFAANGIALGLCGQWLSRKLVQ